VSLLRGYCPTCNGPLWRTEEIMGIGGAYDVDVCRLCWLYSMTSIDVRHHDDEERDFTAEGESINACLRWVYTEAELTLDMVDEANSTENTAATSTWAPDNASDFSAWRGAGIGTDDARNVIWNDVDTAFLVRGAA